MFFFKFIFATLFIFISSYSFSQNHNKIEVDLERVKKDIIDLQKYVYQNNSPNIVDSKNQDLEQINNQIQLLLEKFNSFEKQIKDMKDNIANLNQLYKSLQFDQNKSIPSSNELTLDESSSNLVTEKSNDNESSDKFTITKSKFENEISTEVEEDLPEQTLGRITISILDEQEIINLEPSEEGLNTLIELDSLISEKEIENNKPKIDVNEQWQIAKKSIASHDNQGAINSLVLIIDSDTDDLELLSESYYFLGKINFEENNMVDAVKYFGKHHLDYANVSKRYDSNYFWLGRSLFGMGDQENGCLIMEEIIFSDKYLNNPDVIEDSKSLQAEQDCGLIIN